MTKKIDSFQLKLLAITGMLINHMGIVFEWSRSMPTLPLFAISEFVGKFTFPIMAYLLVEGYHYTRDVKKYALRLAGFWVLSIYPFYLLHRPDYAFSLTDVPNNIFFTLLMGLLLLIVYDKVKHPVGRVLLVLLFAGLTLFSDWNLFGVLLIWAFYTFHTKKGIAGTMLAYFLFFGILALIGLFTTTTPVLSAIELFSTTGFLAVGYLLLHYNGKRGYSPSWVKWGFYAFYPLHLILLEAVRYVLF